MNLLFHIGLPKTATSALQNVLYTNSQLLRELKVLYPHSCLWHDKSHHPIIFDIANINTWQNQTSLEKRPLSLLKDEIKASKNRINTLLVSSELAAGRSPKLVLQSLEETLGPFGHIDVVFSLRNLYSYIFSNYCQRLQDPAIACNKSFYDFCNSPSSLREIISLIEWVKYIQLKPNIDYHFDVFEAGKKIIPCLNIIEKILSCKLHLPNTRQVRNQTYSLAMNLIFLRINQSFPKGDLHAQLVTNLKKNYKKSSDISRLEQSLSSILQESSVSEFSFIIPLNIHDELINIFGSKKVESVLAKPANAHNLFKYACFDRLYTKFSDDILAIINGLRDGL